MTFLISLSRISSEPPLPPLEEVWERHAYPTNHSSLHMSTRSANGDFGTDKVLDTNMVVETAWALVVQNTQERRNGTHKPLRVEILNHNWSCQLLLSAVLQLRVWLVTRDKISPVLTELWMGIDQAGRFNTTAIERCGAGFKSLRPLSD
jgi:hypothetical protein